MKIENLPVLIYQNKRMDRKTFTQKCAACAQAFGEKNVQNGSVAIVMNKSMELVISMYSCFLYGYTFVPVDPAYPDDRIRQILEDMNPTMILTDQHNKSRISADNCYEAEVFLEEACSKYQSEQHIQERDLQEVEVTDDMRSTIYFTSGSTGKPKGVIVKKKGQLTHLKGLAKYIDFSSVKQSICLTSISFDVFFDQTIMPIYYGLSLIIADDHQTADPRKMVELMKESEIDIISVTPSRINQIMEYDKTLECMKKIKYLMVGGEACSQNLLKAMQTLTDAKIYNMYGPTEASVYATISDMTEKAAVDIGVPLPEYKIYILDEGQREVPENTKGEIAIGGPGVAEGYFGLKELTAKRFISLPEKPSERVYLTGDIGMKDSDGILRCYGRIDHQIKYKGFRIELEEIESVTNTIAGVKESLAALQTLENGVEILGLWYTGELTDKQVFREYWQAKLPAYMIPARIYHLDKFEYTTNGKLNRNVAYSVEGILEAENTQKKELSEIGEYIITGIGQGLNIDKEKISLDSSLAEVGINSITYVRILVEVEKIYGIELSPELLMMNSEDTVGMMIQRIEEDIKKISQRKNS